MLDQNGSGFLDDDTLSLTADHRRRKKHVKKHGKQQSIREADLENLTHERWKKSRALITVDLRMTLVP
jgi:hypothetical protein